MKKTTKKVQVEVGHEIMKIVHDGYHNRNDYPPYALTPWEDRNRFADYAEKVINELGEKGILKFSLPTKKRTRI